MPDRHQEEERIFHAARKIKNPAARSAYLDRACGDDAARRARMDVLFAAHDVEDDFLNVPAIAVQPTFHVAPVSEKPGDVIGRYKLLQQIGEGGFGVVYMAEQQEPIRRRVALKIIKLGMDTKAVIARFEAERQALALMDHPNIAKVLDAGATDTGRPYFVMELVHGIRITEYCDKNNQTTRERLDLFSQICSAIQHAHQKGIIHRDLKPTNVLVTLHDGKPVPKVIDFGLAKAMDRPLTDRTLFTAFGQFVGTPQYMSPEQAEMSGLDVDTRADIYSLGVLLYELLTGTTPFESERLRSAGYREVCRIIREEEPPKPSTRISTLGDSAIDVAKHRHTEPAALGRLVRGDLDWIVMKALEKDRTRRYETASAFADDIQRHLSDEPVMASPPSAAYRLRKFVRRNRLAVTASVLVAAALVLGLSLATVGFIQARREHARAVDEYEARLEAEHQAEEERVRTELEKHAREAEAKRRHEQERWGLVAEARSLTEDRHYHWALEKLENAAQMRQDYTTRLLAWILAGQYRDSPIRRWPTRSEALFVGFHPRDGTLVSCGRGNPVWVAPDGTLASYDPGYAPADDMAPLAERDGLRTLYGFDYHCFALSPDGGTVASGAWPRDITLWDTATGTRRTFIQAPAGPVCSLAFSPDGRLMAAGNSADQTVVLYDVATGAELRRLPGEEGHAFAVAFSPDGKALAVGGWGRIGLWDATNGERLVTFEGHSERVWSLCFSPDGTILASTGSDTTVRLWDTRAGSDLCVLGGHEDWATAVDFSPDGRLVASGGSDGLIKLWDVNAQRELRAFSGHIGMVSSVAFSPDGKALACASRDGKTTLWNVASGELQRESAPQSAGVECMAHSPDGMSLATCSGGTITLWDPARGSALRALTAESLPLGCIAFSPDGRTLGVGSHKWVLLWDLATGWRLPKLRGHAGEVNSIAFSPDGERLLSGSADKTLRLWDLGSGSALQTLAGHDGEVLAVAFSPDGRTFASGSADNSVKVWDATTGEALRALSGHTDGVQSLAFSPSGDLLASGSHDRTIRLWDPATGTTQRTIATGHATSVWCLAFSSDGATLASRGSGNVKLWDVRTGRLMHTAAVPGAQGMALAPDGKTLACGGSFQIWVHDATAGREPRVLTGHAEPVRAIALSPDGGAIASGDRGGTVRIWDAAADTEPQKLDWPEGVPVEALAFSPDGAVVASAGEDMVVRLLDARTGNQLAALPGHTGTVRSLAYSPDGRSLASGGADRTVRIWDVQRAMELRSMRWGSGAGVMSVALSPDGRTVASGSWNEPVRLWDAETGQQRGEFLAGSVYRVAFSREGEILAAATHENIFLYDVAAGEMICGFRGHRTGVVDVAFSPDGNALASVGQDDMLKLWDVATGREIGTLHPPGGHLRSVLFTPDGRSLICSAGNDILIYDLHAYDEQIERWLEAAPVETQPQEKGEAEPGETARTSDR